MLNKHTMQELWRFGTAGGIGFLVDVLVHYVAVALSWDVCLGKVATLFCATFAIWQDNRNFALAATTPLSSWVE